MHEIILNNVTFANYTTLPGFLTSLPDLVLSSAFGGVDTGELFTGLQDVEGWPVLAGVGDALLFVSLLGILVGNNFWLIVWGTSNLDGLDWKDTLVHHKLTHLHEINLPSSVRII